MISNARLWCSGLLLLTVCRLGVEPRSRWASALSKIPRPDLTRLHAPGFLNNTQWHGTNLVSYTGSPLPNVLRQSSVRNKRSTIYRAKRRLDVGATNVVDAPATGTANIPGTNPGSVLGRLWKTVKRIFGGRDARGELPVAPGAVTNRLRALNVQGMRPAPVFNFQLALPVADGASGADNSDASPYGPLVNSQPSAVMSMFVERAPLRVREAVKSTVAALVGTFYRYCVETTMITTAERLSALIHSMQMTGYMLWNAECRYCLAQQLQPEPITKESTTSSSPEAADNAGAQLKDDIIPTYNTDSLLSYIKRLPDDTANSLLENITTGVLDAMQDSTDMVVESLTGMAMAQQPPPQPVQPGGAVVPRIIIQQTGSSCVQLCFWQLALGYCLRDQEAKLELQNALKGS
ncbi:signal peptide-containing protein, putative [Babesia ovata]|uniref:Signal peptide-containing protein, putative n=1 Tax=Babesia ovata TaxID=189622 RepID=A0A2H6KGP4_9APIC|nr:signal peptide-containing protein, putative [Babesia ovata]GBE62139.1 signal peptide-containing protein, putative [Babesia ovata]